MELLLAGAAGLFGQGVVGAVNNGEADHAVLYSLESLINIVLPQSQTLHYAAILSTNNIQTHHHSKLKNIFTAIRALVCDST